MDVTELFWNATLEELKCGYLEHEHYYLCLLCGKYFEKGIIYPEDGVMYDAGRYVCRHIEKTHESVFKYLLQLDKKLTGLTEHQRNLLGAFYQGQSDKEIQLAMGIGSASTIRNHRFVLKEKERQARLFLAMMELLREKDKYAPRFLNIHQTARMVDERYNVTLEEEEQILQKYFPAERGGLLKTFPRREKHKLIILRHIAARLERARNYSEPEINQILKTAYDDYATIRRYLIEYGFLDREPDGSRYWLKQ